jgi:hypothetical protein
VPVAGRPADLLRRVRTWRHQGHLAASLAHVAPMPRPTVAALRAVAPARKPAFGVGPGAVTGPEEMPVRALWRGPRHPDRQAFFISYRDHVVAAHVPMLVERVFDVHGVGTGTIAVPPDWTYPLRAGVDPLAAARVWGVSRGKDKASRIGFIRRATA